MNEPRDTRELGNCVGMLLLNNRMHRDGRISDAIHKKISAEILSAYQRSRSV